MKRKRHSLTSFTDAELRDLLARLTPDHVLYSDVHYALVERNKSLALKRMSSAKRSFCNKHGELVRWDNQGAYSTGYPFHCDEQGRFKSNCDAYDAIDDFPTDEHDRAERLYQSIKFELFELDNPN